MGWVGLLCLAMEDLFWRVGICCIYMLYLRMFFGVERSEEEFGRWISSKDIFGAGVVFGDCVVATYGVQQLYKLAMV